MGDSKDKALKSIFKGGVIVFVGTIISKFVSLLYRILVGQTGVSEYGQISVMISVFSVGLLFAQIGIPNGVQRYISYYRGKNNEERVIGSFQTGLKIITISSIVTGVLLFISAGWLAREVFHNTELILLIQMAAIAIPFRAYGSLGTHVTNALEKMQYEIIIDKIIVNLSQLFLAGTLIYLGYSYIGAGFAYAATFVLSGVLGIYFAYREFPQIFTANSDFTNFRTLFKHSWPLVMAGVFAKITGNIDTFMIQSLINSESVGLYQAAYPFASALALGSGIFGSIFLSNASELISKGEKETLRTTYRTVVKWTSITMAPMFLIGFVFPKAFLSLFGSEYYAASEILRILSLGFLISGLVGPASNIYQAIERTKLNFYTTAIVGVSNLVLNLILIPMMGVEGAAWASTIALSIGAIINTVVVYSVTGKQPFRKSILKVWGAGIISVALIYLLNNLLFANTPKIFFLVDIILLGVIYSVIMLILGTIEEEDLVIIKAIKSKTGIESERLERIIRKFI